MKIAYFLHLDVDRYEGVAKKIADKISTWKELGHSVALFCVVPSKKDYTPFKEFADKHYYADQRIKGIPLNYALDWFHLSPLYRNVLRDLEAYKPDIVYYRKNLYSPMYTRLNKRFKSVLEINTNETSEFELLAKEGWKYKLISFLHNRNRSRAFEGVNGIVSVTHEIIALEKKQNTPHLIVPNAIPLDPKNFVRAEETDRKPRLVFIGTPGMPWHGVDILLEIARRAVNDLDIHIIGYTREELAEEIPPNVTVHGFLPKQRYSEIIKNSDIGVGTLGLFRKGMEEACPLKVREYIYYGKPVIIGYKDTALFHHAKPDWILELPNNESGIITRVDEIVSFAREFKAKSIDFKTAFALFDAGNYEKRRMNFLEQFTK